MRRLIRLYNIASVAQVPHRLRVRHRVLVPCAAGESPVIPLRPALPPAGVSTAMERARQQNVGLATECIEGVAAGESSIIPLHSPAASSRRINRDGEGMQRECHFPAPASPSSRRINRDGEGMQRECHFPAPASPSSRRFSRHGEGASAEWRSSRRWRPSPLMATFFSAQTSTHTATSRTQAAAVFTRKTENRGD